MRKMSSQGKEHGSWVGEPMASPVLPRIRGVDALLGRGARLGRGVASGGERSGHDWRGVGVRVVVVVERTDGGVVALVAAVIRGAPVNARKLRLDGKSLSHERTSAR